MKLKNIKEGKTMPYVLWVLDGDDRQWKMYKGVNDAKKFIADNDYDEFLDALNTQVFPNATYHNNYIDWIVIPAGEEPRKFDTHKFYNALRTEQNKVTKKKSMKESYSDIDYDNLWEAYDIAADVLGYEELCLSLAKAMGEDELLSNLKYIFRTWDIPFMDDEEFDEGCHGRKTKKKTRKLKEDSAKKYGRYLVKISIYKNMYKLDYIDEHWDKSNYCFFDENGYLNTDYSGISRDLFDKIYDRSMKPGHVYEVYTDGPYGDIIGFEEVPYGWFR